MWHVVLSGVFKCHMSERKREWLDTEQILCLLLAHPPSAHRRRRSRIVPNPDVPPRSPSPRERIEAGLAGGVRGSFRLARRLRTLPPAHAWKGTASKGGGRVWQAAPWRPSPSTQLLPPPPRPHDAYKVISKGGRGGG
jgi:hypothetical protein